MSQPQLLSPQQVHAANLLAAGSPIEEVCTQLNLGRTTLYRWRQLPSFAAYLNQLTRQYADQALTQSTCLLATAMHFLQQKLTDPNTPPDMQLRIAFRIVALYSRPSYLRFLQTLPDNPAEVEEQQMRQALRVAGLPADHPMDGSDVQLFRDYQHGYLQQAQAFDAHFGDSPAPQRTKMEQNGTSGAKQAKAVDAALAAPDIPLQWTKVEQNGTRGAQQKCAAAVDAALAGVRERIAAAVA